MLVNAVGNLNIRDLIVKCSFSISPKWLSGLIFLVLTIIDQQKQLDLTYLIYVSNII